jgi:cyclic beta-1,2-glucan synthetase
VNPRTSDGYFAESLAALPGPICRLHEEDSGYSPAGPPAFQGSTQDITPLLHARPEIARQHILTAAEHQFESGDVLHWWHPPSGRGLRTRISDNLLWLPFVTSRYVEVTGDDAILDEQVPFLAGSPLEPTEKERYIQSSEHTKPETLFSTASGLSEGDTSGRHGLLNGVVTGMTG